MAGNSRVSSATSAIASAAQPPVKRHCADDTALERDLGDFIERYGYVVNTTPGATWPTVLRLRPWAGL
jgi:hypothetical protein